MLMPEARLFPAPPRAVSFARSQNDGLSALESAALYDIVTFGIAGVAVGRYRPSSVLTLLDDTVIFGIVDVATVTFGIVGVVVGRYRPSLELVTLDGAVAFGTVAVLVGRYRPSSLEYAIDLDPPLVSFCCSNVDSL